MPDSLGKAFRTGVSSLAVFASLLFVSLFVLYPSGAAAQTGGIPPYSDQEPTRADVTNLGEICSNTTGAIKNAGAFAEGGNSIDDTCLAETATHRISCTYDSANGTFHAATYCAVTYKEIPPPNNTRIFDVSVIGNVATATTTQDVADHSTPDSNPTVGGKCSPADIGACIRALPGMLFTGIAFIFLTLSGLILMLAGTVFNWVVIRTVFQFGTYFGTNEGMLVAWGVMRDIANIALLFGFIFMGVLLILNVGGGGHGHGGGISAKKAIPRLIIFAVLLNFSLFASQAVIDVANAFSSSFATLAGENCSTNTSTGTSSSADQTNEECANVGISGQILKVAGLTSIWDSESRDLGAALGNLVDRPYSYAVSLIMLSVFVLVTAIVLLAGSIMLIIRVVVLSLLMVTSPVGFAGMAIPKLQGIASMWWSKLMSQAFFAPIYLLLIFISIKLTEGLMQGEATLANALIANEGNSVAGNMQVVMVFLIVIGFMIGSLIAASRIGAAGASFAANTASSIAFGSLTRGSNLVGGGAARIGRFGLQNAPGNRNAAWRQGVTNRVLRPLERANLDARKVPGMAGMLGAAGITAGAKPAEHATYGDMAHQVADIRSGEGSKKLTRQYESELADSELEKNAHNDAMTKEDMEHLSSLTTKQLEALHGIKDGVAQMAQNLTPGQFESLMSSKELGDEQKGKLRDSRLGALKGASADEVKKWSTKDIEQLANSSAHADLISNPAFLEKLSDEQADALTKKLSPSQKTAFDAARNERFEPARAASTINGMSAEKVAKLHPSIIAKPAVHTAMSGRQLAAIDPDKLSPPDLAAIKAHISAQRAGGTAAGKEFDALMLGNPKVRERWGGVL